MRAANFVGRVGGLAVALGVGVGIGVGGVATAWAAPADSASTSAGEEGSAVRSSSPGVPDRRTARPERTSRAVGQMRGGLVAEPDHQAGEFAVSGGASRANPRWVRAGAAMDPGAVLATRDSRSSIAAEEDYEPVAASGTAPLVGAPDPVASSTAAAVAAEAVEINAEKTTLDIGMESMAVVAVPVSGPAAAVGASARSSAEAVAEAGVTVTAQEAESTAVVESAGSDLSGPMPDVPVESPAGWVVLAAARREIGEAGVERAASVGPGIATALVTDPVALDPIGGFFEQVQGFIGQASAFVAQAVAVVSRIVEVIPQVVAVIPRVVTAVLSGSFAEAVTLVSEVAESIVESIMAIFAPATVGQATSLGSVAAATAAADPVAAAAAVTGGQQGDPEQLGADTGIAGQAADLVELLPPSARAEAENPIAAIFEQIGAVFTQIVQTLTQVFTQFVEVVTQVIGSIFGGFDPGPPDNTDLTFDPVWEIDSITGVVTGTMAGRDPSGGVLSFSAPATTAKGTVVINAVNGDFVYTPTAAAREDAGKAGATEADKTDSFTVTVADEYGGTTSVTVTVAVSPSSSTPPGPTNRPPVTSGPTVGNPDATTGIVVGKINAIDSDGDTVTFSGPTSTAKGAVGLNSSTGAFTYTPTTTARQDAGKAGATEADRSDSFTVTVTDGYGGSASVTVVVAVSPAPSTPPGPTNRPPVTSTPTVGNPDTTTGVVVGRINATDPDGDTVIFSGPAFTAKGSVSLNSSTGAFTYTPTTTARQSAGKAGATEADKSDAFTVTVSDGYGGTLAVPVKVTISPTGLSSAPSVIATIGLGKYPDGLAVSPNGSRVYVTGTEGYRGSVSVIDTATNTVIQTIGVGDEPKGVAVSPNGSRAYVTHRLTSPFGMVSVIDTATSAVIKTIGVGAFPWGVAVTPNGSRVYVTDNSSVTVGGFTGSVSVIDTATNTVIKTIGVGQDPHGVAVSPNGSRVYVTNSGSDSVAVIDTATNTVIKTIGVGDYPWGVAVSPNGTRAYVTNSWSDSVSVIDTATNTVIKTISGAAFSPGGSSEAEGVAVSPDGSRAYVAKGYVVSVIETATNTVIQTISGQGNVREVAVSPNGNRAYVTDYGYKAVSVINTGTAPPPPRANTNPEITKVTVGTPVAGTGVVTGSVTATDADKDKLTYSAPASTAKGGTVSVNAASGAFTYTPSDTARFTATRLKPTTAQKTDTFTVTVADGFGGQATQAVTVDVAPMGPALGALAKVPQFADQIYAEKIQGSDGSYRMVVYLSGMDQPRVEELATAAVKAGLVGITAGLVLSPGEVSAITGFAASNLPAFANNTGVLRQDVQNYIDDAYDKFNTTTARIAEIQLVGHSNGGQQMQAYASAGTHRDLVTSLVVYGSPLIKKTDELGNVKAIAFRNLADPVPWISDTLTARAVVNPVRWDKNGKAEYRFGPTNLCWDFGCHSTGGYRDYAAQFDAATSFADQRTAMQRFTGTVVAIDDVKPITGFSPPVLLIPDLLAALM